MLTLQGAAVAVTLTLLDATTTSACDADSAPTADMVRVRAAATDRGLATELLVSNDSDRLGAFDPRALHRLLSDPDHITQVAEQVATMAAEGGWGGVNVDFERVPGG